MPNLFHLGCLAFFYCNISLVQAGDWLTYRHDNRRSGVTDENPSFPLKESWVRHSSVPPMMAWAGPAKWDAYSGNKDLQSMRNFDPAFYVTVKENLVFYGSSVDHAVHCLDANKGKELWACIVPGAVRLPPTLVGGSGYFGADDGNAYCLDLGTGKIKWSFRASTDNRFIASNGKLISLWPVRTGILVSNSTAYFAASLVPWETSYVCAVDCDTGNPKYLEKGSDMTLQGALLASTKTLYAPQGRSVPLLFNLADGKRLKGVGNSGGTFCLLTEDERLVAMPNSQKSSGNVIQITDPSGGAALLQFAGADRLIVSGDMAYLHQQRKLKSLKRKEYSRIHTNLSQNNSTLKKLKEEIPRLQKQLLKTVQLKNEESSAALRIEIKGKQELMNQIPSNDAQLKRDLVKCFGWEMDAPSPYDLILAGDVIFLGSDNEVVAFDVKTGTRLWSGDVKGKVYGLVFSGGRLFASTSLGHIYCFS